MNVIQWYDEFFDLLWWHCPSENSLLVYCCLLGFSKPVTMAKAEFSMALFILGPKKNIKSSEIEIEK